MIIDSYKICIAIKQALRSLEVATIETNPVTEYAVTHFGSKPTVSNQVAINKKNYTRPYIFINDIGQNKKNMNTIQIDIDFSFGVDGIEEEIDGDTVEYKDYFRLSEWATLISQRIQAKANICIPVTQELFRPDEVQIGVNEFKGTLQLTLETVVPISK